MLIPSPRHRPEDLRLWVELEDADRAWGQSAALARKVERSMEEIRKFARQPTWCGVSWGKDSVVVAHLLSTVSPQTPLVWMLYGKLPNPDCAAVRDSYLAIARRQNYREIVAPPRTSRKHKLQRFDLAAEVFGTSRHFSGLRAEESGSRKISMRTIGLSSDQSCRPLGWWTVADVFGYLAANALPVHPAYACLGGGRWPREHLRVASLGGSRGSQFGRGSWEFEYYGPEINRLAARR